MIFKNHIVAERWSRVHPKLREIISDADRFALEHYGYELVITETATTLQEDVLVGRESATHRDLPYARAVDVRTHDMPKSLYEVLKAYLLDKYGKLGAISNSTMKPNLIYDREHGTGPHWHVQIQRGIKV